jgi:predicted enzyme related to lactoylglutathione lyase
LKFQLTEQTSLRAFILHYLAGSLKKETGNYWMIKNAGISGGLAPRENTNQIPTMFVEVESIDAYIGKARQLGAKVVKNKQEIGPGYYAVMEDPQKNTFGIWQGKK